MALNSSQRQIAKAASTSWGGGLRLNIFSLLAFFWFSRPICLERLRRRSGAVIIPLYYFDTTGVVPAELLMAKEGDLEGNAAAPRGSA